MSFALQALVLLRADAYRGEWLLLDAIAGHIGLRATRVREACDEMVAAGLLQYAARDGRHYYGVRCEGRRVPETPPPPATTTQPPEDFT